MNPSGTGRVFAFGAFLLLFAAHPARAQRQAEWTWKDADGKTHTRAELDGILRKHEQWLESKGKSGSQADLQRADLSGANFMIGVNLNRALLGRVHLDDAWLVGAHLMGADLSDARLVGAVLVGADLNGAELGVADLTNADLYKADLGGAIFEPKSLPELRGIATATNLELLTYDDNPYALAQLRKQFEDGGFREQERKITYALKRREAELSWDGCRSRKLPGEEEKTRAILWSSESTVANCGSFVLNRVFFDLTCQYGMSPGRPLLVGFSLWLLCAFAYAWSIHRRGESGLYQIETEHGGSQPSPSASRVRLVPGSIASRSRWKYPFLWLRREWRVLRMGMFFSLMSGFRLGIGDIQSGRWLRLLTRHEFDLKALGWVRVVAGWQSLISLYLVVLWALTYFGRPFG